MKESIQLEINVEEDCHLQWPANHTENFKRFLSWKKWSSLLLNYRQHVDVRCTRNSMKVWTELTKASTPSTYHVVYKVLLYLVISCTTIVVKLVLPLVFTSSVVSCAQNVTKPTSSLSLFNSFLMVIPWCLLPDFCFLLLLRPFIQ